jgi:hypothetical protein
MLDELEEHVRSIDMANGKVKDESNDDLSVFKLLFCGKLYENC